MTRVYYYCNTRVERLSMLPTVTGSLSTPTHRANSAHPALTLTVTT
jgi:hypothetical protein